jgi:hypothetical protein
MAINLPPAASMVLAAAEASTGDVEDLNLVGSLAASVADPKAISAEERKGMSAEITAFNLMPLRDSGRAVWPMYWQPISTLTDDKGKIFYSPDVAYVDDDAIDYWLLRSLK